MSSKPTFPSYPENNKSTQLNGSYRLQRLSFLKVCESPNIVISLNSAKQFCDLSERR